MFVNKEIKMSRSYGTPIANRLQLRMLVVYEDKAWLLWAVNSVRLCKSIHGQIVAHVWSTCDINVNA